jgi:hypothetical protein
VSPSAHRSVARDATLAAVSLAALALPFLAVRDPPIADLPQQVAQIRLFAESWTEASAVYRVQWSNPNRLSYLLLGGSWLAVGPREAGRVAMLAIGALWIAAAHVIARRRGRPAEAAVLASLVFFNHTTYWGFYSFSCGLPLFVLFVDLTDRLPARSSWADRGKLLGATLLLFLTHALWFAAGLAWLALSALVFKGPRATVSRLLTVSPLVAWAVAWTRTLGGTPFDAPPVWKDVELRYRAEWLVDATLGGLRGDAEEALAKLFLAWVVVGVVVAALRRLRPRPEADAVVGASRPAAAGSPERWDGTLLLAAAMLVAGAAILPNKTHGTIRFAERWMPMAAFFALLAAPTAPWLRRIAAPAVAAVALAYSAFTAGAWQQFERRELAGLHESVAALPSGPTVLGLDLVKESDVVRGRPFLQTFAWSQVLHGGDVHFSFARFPSSLVGLRDPKREPWTPNLVWYGERARPSDVSHFDYVLVNAADDGVHAAAAARLNLSAVTERGRWRLYRPGALTAKLGAPWPPNFSPSSSDSSSPPASSGSPSPGPPPETRPTPSAAP